ncbi:uncharacterized protein TRIVIDRAFT_175991 [Trichoderma virens Gv29-8]|uniref:Uncharacterized protein n=1 Tax=Hypocrea virens (strain Gv29-8 / FGSC 10586) TaxID=413071 RepID=G9MDU4_HYPVG|nr:uncharacterized protein TRIVIDRAFT_175991 [Trichoderma virens Gv29-8]EHK27253.1 hypothetical protein TRIVIDRAFT_175991 [Trichoderma virens Gv29-8]
MRCCTIYDYNTAQGDGKRHATRRGELPERRSMSSIHHGVWVICTCLERRQGAGPGDTL